MFNSRKSSKSIRLLAIISIIAAAPISYGFSPVAHASNDKAIRVAVIARQSTGPQAIAKDQMVAVLTQAGFGCLAPPNSISSDNIFLNDSCAAGSDENLIFTVVHLNNNQSSTNAYNITKALLHAGYNAILGTSTSSQAAGISQAISEVSSGKDPVPYIEAAATSDSINVGVFHRISVASSKWGAVAAEKSSTLPISGTPQLAYIRRINEADFNGTLTADPFGVDAKTGWDGQFGVASKDVIINNTGTLFRIDGADYTANTLSSSPLGSGTWLMGSVLATQNVQNVVDALRSLDGNNLSPRIWLVSNASVSPADGVNYSADNWTWLQAHALGIVPHYWEDSPAYASWKTWSDSTFPNDPTPTAHTSIRGFDAAVLMVVGLVHSRSAGGAHHLIDHFSKPDGMSSNEDDLLPGNFLEALESRKEADSFNFEGASGPIDFEKGECGIIYFTIWVGPSTGDVFAL